MSQDQQQQLLLPLPLPPPLNNNYPNQEHSEQQQPLSFSGRWIPLPKILYGTTIYPFNPIQIDPRKVDIKGKGKQPTEEPSQDNLPNLVPANPNQVPLDVGDECYVFEQYLPASHPIDPSSIWYRGYVVTISHQPSSLSNLPVSQLNRADSQPFESTTNNTDHFHSPAHLPDEPQVFLGIFPASHLQIREHLDDSSHRSDRSLAQIRAASAAHLHSIQGQSNNSNNAHLLRSFSKDSGPMEPLPEEDESDLITTPLNQHPSQKANEPPDHEKLSTPLPSLKAGDETVSGRDEPLIDEIACALREWYTLLFVHLHRRRYQLFHLMKLQIEALHMGRRQLLAQTLSTEEAAKLRRDLVNRLVYGNYIQHLDIIVRHPDYGALVDSEVEIEAVDSRSWMSIIRMYVYQVKLAYLSPALNSPTGAQAILHLAEPSGSNALSSISANNQSKLCEPNQIPLNAHLPSLRNTRSNGPTSVDMLTSPHGTRAQNCSGSGYRPKFYHMMLEIKSFLASPCVEGEMMELYFSLYNKSESRFLTEEFCIILNHMGLPQNSNPVQSRHLQHMSTSYTSNPGGESHLGVGQDQKANPNELISLRTMFKDISPHDVQDSIFLVCRLVKNGAMKTAAGHSNHTATIQTMQETSHTLSVSPSGYEPDFNSLRNSFDVTSSDAPTLRQIGQPREAHGMTFTSLKSGSQSVRRPYGCAVVELAQFSSQSSQMLFGNTPNSAGMSRLTSQTTATPSNVFEPPTSRYTMNIFSPVSEASFPTLHEDIIASRTKEFFGSGNLTSNGPGHNTSSNKNHQPPQGLGPKNEAIEIQMKTYYGDTNTILKENSSMLSDVPVTSRLGFPDVVYPDDSRNEIYIKLWSGDFSNLSVGASKMISASGSGKNIEVAAELRTNTGQLLERMISRGSGEPKVTRYNSMVYRNNQTPTWGELMKLDISSETIEICHLFFTFRNRQEKSTRNNNGQTQMDKPFAFAYLPLFSSNRTFIPDGEHSLILFKYDEQSAMPEVYCRVRPTVIPGQAMPEITPALSKLLIPLKDSFIVRSFLCSTLHTQDEVLLRLMKWNTLLDDPDGLRQTLTKLKFASEVEICKFLRNIFDALFGVLVSRANAETKEYEELVFNALVTLLGIVSDRRFTNFKPVVDLYIDHHFSSTTASTHLLQSFQNLLINPTSPENAHPLRCSIKVWGYLMRFIVRSRELQRIKELNAPSSGLMCDAVESKFKVDISTLLGRINNLMTTDSSSIIGTQTLAVQHFASLMTELAKVFTPLELLEKANAFCESIKVTKGKIVMWKLLLQEHIVMSPIFDQADGRLQLVPKLTTWVKPHLGEFEDYLMFKPQDNDVIKHSARVTWLEGIRIAVAVIAVALDKLHEVLIDPAVCNDPGSLAQEHDNIEYLLGLLPKLLESFREFESPANVEIVQRLGTTASVISSVPIVFPATYPFSLLNSLPPKPNLNPSNSMSNPNDPNNNPSVGQQNNPPTVQNALGEIAVVMITMIMLAPSQMLKNHLELMLEVEGKINFGKFLSKIFKAFYSILKNASFPSNWLNINVISHKAILKLLEVVSKILQREFIPTTANEHDQSKEQMNLKRAGHVREEPSGSEEEERFDSNLWSDFFVLNHGLLSSKLLIIEEYPPQKRRVIWKLAGDIRDEGSKIFRAAWESIGDFSITIGSHNPADNSPNQDSQDNPDLNKEDTDQLTGPQHQINEVTRCGGYQVQFVPGFIEPLLELCLSHHDELRSNAVIVLYSVIVSEFNLNRDFTVIADEIIDKLDNLLGSSPNENLSNQMDEMSRASFVGQLRALFDHSPIIDRQEDPGQQGQQAGIEQALKTQIDLFLDSLTQFLDLLLSIRNLPPGDEFIDDRVIGTLKLMSFIRNIGRSGIYIHYVHKLVNFHAAHGNFVEAGLALRLHADLHEWDLNSIVDAMPGLSLPKQTVFARKEALYFRILDFLSKGKAWESGIQICKELQEQYEHVSFDYERLSEVLAHQSSLFLKIVKTDRYFSEYFRVAFYGQGFPPSVQNRQFVYRGYEWEKYAAFCDRMHNKHPNAQIIQSDAISTDELAYAEGQYLQITRVVAEPDRTTVVFKNPEVSSSVVSYYEHNATNTFSHSKPFNKDNVDPSDTVRMWVEKTFLVCEDVFPTVLKRSEILEIRVLEISPIENAIMITEQKTRELESLHRRYLALTKTSDAKLNTNPLSMALNSIVDTPAKTGIPAFRNVFLTPNYLEEHPQQVHPVQMLRQAIDHQTTVINASLQLHQYLCPPEMKAFHATLHKFFVKNFAEEIGRLPLSSSLNAELFGAQPEGSEDTQADLTQQPGRHDAYSLSRGNSFATGYDGNPMVNNGVYQPNGPARPSLSLSLGGLSPPITNPYGQHDSHAQPLIIGASPSIQTQFQQGYNFPSSSSSLNPSLSFNTMSGGQSSVGLSRSMTMTSSHQNPTGNYHEGQVMDKQSVMTVGGGGGEGYEFPGQQMEGANLVRTMSGPSSGFAESVYQSFNTSVHGNNRVGDLSTSGSSTLVSGSGPTNSGPGINQNPSGFGKLIRKGTGTILSHNSGSSRGSFQQNSSSISNQNLAVNQNPPSDRRSILGIRFGSRHK
ncbi:hypothetical protein PGT21_031228 [Puccinia graminis f. sp. tritici]|uniref:Dedicator of cytokinesis n=2 Tax=Puccinia graminis f. sp. tritici TaxID=56615 RepID=E3KGB2_PUCGT|nr:uncharacterized protein PGTG_08523 [Puccinia graminis f. sp. tritici CRL 75-36-700-3]EFP83337.2 hypothetical protein PGTG_08523 [Puccinia graminis f. sp. tritici CRL 75-36-700-3]KAA1078230.1 hypothetical protein PGT21_031228 [Puccinia graminis f. sp. tritici]